LVFEVVLNETSNEATDGSRLEGRSVVVEIEAEGLLKALAITPDPAEATRHEAAELACRAAVQTIEKDLPAGVEPACSPSPMDHLPDGLQERAPTLHTPLASAWLV
jgi:hypothetical protein